MPRGVTPKERMTRSILTLAKNLKPSGRLNVDDITKAGELRKGMTRKDYKMTNIKRKMDEDYVKKYDNKMKSMPIPSAIKPEKPNFKLTEKKGFDVGSKFTAPPKKTKAPVDAPQTRTYGNKPTESVFQKLKRAQMLRKMSK